MAAGSASSQGLAGVEFEPWLLHPFTERSEASSCSPGLRFPICNMGIIIVRRFGEMIDTLRSGPSSCRDKCSVNVLVVVVIVIITITVVSILLLKASQGLKTLEGAVAFACHCPCFGAHRNAAWRLCPWNADPTECSWVREASGVTQVWGQLGSAEISSFFCSRGSQTPVPLLEDTRVCDAPRASLAVEPPCSWSIS